MAQSINLNLVSSIADMGHGDHVSHQFHHLADANAYNYFWSKSFTSVESIALLADWQLLFANNTDHIAEFLYKTDEFYILIWRRNSEKRVNYSAASKTYSPEKWKALIDAIDERLVRIKPKLDNVLINFSWWSQTNGKMAATRSLIAPKWSNIAENYTASARDTLDQLFKLTPQSLPEGRIIILHGRPGSGKTFIVRALCEAWAKWAIPTYIVDPEAFFHNPSYMVQSILQPNNASRYTPEAIGDFFTLDEEDTFDCDDEPEDTSSQSKPKWNIFLLEDAEEFILSDAKSEVGQAVSRLLNMSDGLLGQGLPQLFVITTNVPFSSMHPAVLRDGRCMANLKIDWLEADEANLWLKNHDSKEAVHESTALAKLYAMIGRSQLNLDQTGQTWGMYA